MAVVDLNDIKEQVQTKLQSANTTSSSNDLSDNLPTRVQRIVKTNSTRIPIQATWYPYVSIHIGDKITDTEVIATSNEYGKRMGTVNMQIIGGVWNSIFEDVDEDLSDEDCENLMMNIEAILAEDVTLSDSVTWHQPTVVQYHNIALDEGANLRVGIMNVQCTVFY